MFANPCGDVHDSESGVVSVRRGGGVDCAGVHHPNAHFTDSGACDMSKLGVPSFRQRGLRWAAAAVLAVPGAVWAGAQDFTVNNATGVDVYELYVSPASSDDWQEDVLGVDVLEDGDSVEISFDRDEDAAYWDLMVVDSEGDNIQWYRLKLTEISEVTLRIRNGKAIAEVE
jgi:hypothetical protein